MLSPQDLANRTENRIFPILKLAGRRTQSWRFTSVSPLDILHGVREFCPKAVSTLSRFRLYPRQQPRLQRSPDSHLEVMLPLKDFLADDYDKLSDAPDDLFDSWQALAPSVYLSGWIECAHMIIPFSLVFFLSFWCFFSRCHRTTPQWEGTRVMGWEVIA